MSVDLHKFYVHDIEMFPNLFSDIWLIPDDLCLCVMTIYANDQLVIQYQQRLITLYPQYSFYFFKSIEEYMSKIRQYTDSGYYTAGYNSFEYDDVVVTWLFQHYTEYSSSAELLSALHAFSAHAMENNYQYKQQSIARTCDLMRVSNAKRVYKSLKQIAANLLWPRMKECPIPFDTYITSVTELCEIFDYELNDVLITHRLLTGIPQDELTICTPKSAKNGLIPALDSRFAIGQKHGLALFNHDDSSMANQLNNVLYSRDSGIPYVQFKDKRTHRQYIKYLDVINPKITFQTPVLQEFLETVKTFVYDAALLDETNEKAFESYCEKYLTVSGTFCGVPVKFGVGGLHSEFSSYIKKSTATHTYWDADVGSYYPVLSLLEHAYPQHLGDVFPIYYKGLVDQRLHAKAEIKRIKTLIAEIKQSKDDIRLSQLELLSAQLQALNTDVAALKIALNSVFGKYSYKDYWLYDILAHFKICINGQLYLLMLIEQLYLKGFNTIYVNTDGVTVEVERAREAEFKRICKEWEQFTDFELELTEFAKFFHRDVNNYLVVKPDGEVKAKGDYDYRLWIEKYGVFNPVGAFKAPIVPYAVEQYFVHDIPVEETIRKHPHILDFTICGKIGETFTPILFNVITGETEVQQQSLRYYIAKSPYKLLKQREKSDQDHSNDIQQSLIQQDFIAKIVSYVDVAVGYHVQIFNNYVKKPDIQDYRINYDYYIRECEKLITGISGKILSQLQLFALKTQDTTDYFTPPHILPQSQKNIDERVYENELKNRINTSSSITKLVIELPFEMSQQLLSELAIAVSEFEDGQIPIYIHFDGYTIKCADRFCHLPKQVYVEKLQKKNVNAYYEYLIKENS